MPLLLALCLTLPAAQPPAATPAPVKAYDLHAAYLDNALAADGKYRGKELTVTGQVHKVREKDGRYELLLTVRLETVRGRVVESYGVVCRVARGAEDGFKSASWGVWVTVRGAGAGSRRDFDAYRDLAAVLDDCRAVK